MSRLPFFVFVVENRDLTVDLVWDPPWTPDRMAPEAKKRLGFA